MSKGLMVSVAGALEAGMSAFELFRNPGLPGSQVGKLASIFVNGGLAAAWVNSTYKN